MSGGVGGRYSSPSGDLLWLFLHENLSFFFFMPPPFSMARAYSITAVCMYVHLVSPSVRPIHPVRNTDGFCAISFERIGVLD